MGSSATAILKTNSATYDITFGTHFHDGSEKIQNSQGNMFYALNQNGYYSSSAEFTNKYTDKYQNSYTYTHRTFLWANFSSPSVQFLLGQDAIVDGNFQGSPNGSYGFEEFSFNWNFEVLDADAVLRFTSVYPLGTGLYTLENLITGEIKLLENNVSQEYLTLNKGSNYLLSLNMRKQSISDGEDNIVHLHFENASFSVPAPSNILILLLALIAVIPLRKSFPRFA